MSDLWKILHTQLAEADHAYDTRMLHELEGRTQWLQRHRGNAVTLLNHATSGDPTAWANERPFASLRRASVIHLPYWLNPGLSAVHLSIYYRVSNHFYDAGTDTLHSPHHVDLQARLLRPGNGVFDFGAGSVELEPVWQAGAPDDTPPDWGWAQWTLTLDAIPGTGRWSWLTFELQSSRWYTPGDQSGDGLVADSGDAITITPARLQVDGDADYYRESSAPPYDSSHGANETSCSVLVTGDLDKFQGAWDHLKRRRDDPDTFNVMWIWPRTGDTDFIAESNIYKAPLAYLQWRAMTITEVYDDDTRVDPYDLRPAVPTTSRVPSQLARRINAISRRRQLVSGLSMGVLPGSSSQWDVANYRLRCPIVLGETGEPTEVYAQVGDVAGDVAELVVRPTLSSLYYTTAIREDESYAATSDSSLEAFLQLTATVEQLNDVGDWTEVDSAQVDWRTRFVFTNVGGCHHLLALEKQFDITFTPQGDGFVYREGYLDTLTDLEVLTRDENNPTITLDASGLDTYRPCRIRLQVEILDPDSAGAYPGLFLDDSRRQLVANTPQLIRMRSVLLGLSVWSVPP